MIEAAKNSGNSRTRLKAPWLIVGAILLALCGGAVYWRATRPAVEASLPVKSDTRPVEPDSIPEVPEASAWFREVTGSSGLHFTYDNGEAADNYSILETLGGGVALLDFDQDGLLDVFVCGGGYFDGQDKQEVKGRPCQLYRNLGDWKFLDVTRQLGLADVSWWYTHGATVADYDRDGWPDLLVTGYGRLSLFHNESDGREGRRFTDVTEQMGLQDDSWSTSAGWGDLDGDGFPDLYVCHYVDWSFANDPFCPGVVLGAKREVCSPTKFKPLLHALFHNEQGRAFHNVAAEHEFSAKGAGLGVVLADLNDDRLPDIFVANDMTPTFLFFNRAGKLEERASSSGVAVDEQGRANGNMGVDVGDYDGSGRPSLWVTVYQNEQHVLAQNLGAELFLNRSRATGIAAIGQHFVAFGTGFIDVDNDGWEDLVIANGHLFRRPPADGPQQRPVLLRNIDHKGSRFFRDVSAQGGAFFRTRQIGRGLAIGDLDNDGWPDLVVNHTNSPTALLRNQAAAGMATPNRWLGVSLVGRNHRDVVGSTVILEENERKLTRFTKGGGSYLSASDQRILFGLGADEQVRRVTVKWSWGETQSWENLEPNQYWELQEGETAAKSLQAAAR